MSNKGVVEIDLLDMAKYILARWKEVLAMAVVFAFLGSAVCGLDNFKQTQARVISEQLKNDDAEDDVGVESKLTKTQLNEVERAAAVQKALLAEYEKLKSYGDRQLSDEELEELSELTMSINYSESVKRTLMADFTLEQKKALNQRMGKDVIQVIEPEPEPEPDVLWHAIAKGIILGVLLGVFVAMTIIMLRYLFDGKLKTKHDMELVFQLFCLGDIKSNMKRNKENGNEHQARINLCATNIKSLCVKNEIKKVYMNSTLMLSDSEKSCVEEVAMQIQECNIELIECGNAVYDATAMEMMNECGNMIFIEKLYESSCSEIRKVDQLCKEHEVNILGYVLV